LSSESTEALAEKADEQRQAVIDAVVEVTDLLFSGDEIARFVARTRD
jgi:hypothetical protein